MKPTQSQRALTHHKHISQGGTIDKKITEWVPGETKLSQPEGDQDLFCITFETGHSDEAYEHFLTMFSVYSQATPKGLIIDIRNCDPRTFVSLCMKSIRLALGIDIPSIISLVANNAQSCAELNQCPLRERVFNGDIYPDTDAAICEIAA